MCLVAFDWRPNDGDTNDESVQRPSLLLVANRDEYYRRPSQKAFYWKPEHIDIVDDGINTNSFGSNEIYAGKDLLQGGTWLACSNNGRFATITNFHCEEDQHRLYPWSRGEIVSMFVASKQQSKFSSQQENRKENNDHGTD
jgi:uncharacterized protein with NRDE domain